MNNETMMTHNEAALVSAVMKHLSEGPKTKKVRIRSLVHNFAEAILLRDATVQSFSLFERVDYPTEEEINALVEKVLRLTVAVCDEYDRLDSL